MRGCRSWESSECPRPPGSCWTQPPWALRPVFSAGPRPLSRTGIPGCVLSQCWGTGRGRRWRFWGIVEAWRVFGALAAALSPEGPRHRGGPLARTFPKSIRIVSSQSGEGSHRPSARQGFGPCRTGWAEPSVSGRMHRRPVARFYNIYNEPGNPVYITKVTPTEATSAYFRGAQGSSRALSTS